MIKILHSDLRQISSKRPSGYYEEVIRHGRIEDGVLLLEQEAYISLRDKFSHKGLGDKIASNPIVHAIGKATGCVDPKTNQLKPESGCGKMRARLNAGMSVAEAMKLRLQGK